uniref:NADH-ubiquinone oxidoreductase chain 4L n=1 Tax=Stygobromus indentatus TaxID=1678292 RepID=A0A172QHC1_9CRUS|nr:NADH dehydrogenase subunit 4L [Stygobromus indentatus]AND97088.1 NADH dehydrogenase subunit 4L [Stygobromus indentatus]
MELLLSVSGGIMFISGLLKFMLNYIHLLVSLLSLEFISLALFLSLSSMIMFYSSEFFYLLYFIIMIVCEGVLGLVLLVSSVYSHGLDYMKSFNFMLC